MTVIVNKPTVTKEWHLGYLDDMVADEGVLAPYQKSDEVAKTFRLDEASALEVVDFWAKVRRVINN